MHVVLVVIQSPAECVIVILLDVYSGLKTVPNGPVACTVSLGGVLYFRAA